MNIIIENEEKNFSAKYSNESAEQSNIEIGTDAICDIVLSSNLFPNLPKKIISLHSEGENIKIKKLQAATYATINETPFSIINLAPGEYQLQIMQYTFKLTLKS